MLLDLTPLVGQSISSVEKNDYTWSFRLSGADCLFTEQSWRLITGDGILVTSEDHAQLFGLPRPFDAPELVKSTLKSDLILEANHDLKTGDLVLKFSADRYVQFLQMSCGYESWKLRIRDREFICLGGGQYTSFLLNSSSDSSTAA